MKVAQKKTNGTKTNGTTKRAKTKGRTTSAASTTPVTDEQRAEVRRIAEEVVREMPHANAREHADEVGRRFDAPKRTDAEQATIQRENLRGLVDEAVAHVGTLARLFACSDSELDSGEYCGSPVERREEFNHAVAGLVAGLDCIRHNYAASKAVTS